MFALANLIFDEKLSVRDIERMIKEIKNPKKQKEKKTEEKDEAAVEPVSIDA